MALKVHYHDEQQKKEVEKLIELNWTFFFVGKDREAVLTAFWFILAQQSPAYHRYVGCLKADSWLRFKDWIPTKPNPNGSLHVAEVESTNEFTSLLNTFIRYDPDSVALTGIDSQNSQILFTSMAVGVCLGSLFILQPCIDIAGGVQFLNTHFSKPSFRSVVHHNSCLIEVAPYSSSEAKVLAILKLAHQSVDKDSAQD